MTSRLIWLPVSLYLSLIIPIMYWDLDWQLANYWFQLQDQQWYFRHHWLTQTLLHDAGHDLALTLYIVILILYISSFNKRILWHKFKSTLAYLSLSLPVATLTVSLIKRLSFVDCPWSISDFGGQQHYLTWWQTLIADQNGVGHCFPAAHASSAYMFFGVYFVARQHWPDKANWIVTAVLGFGLIFGLAQQLRGAHFISHDLTSAIVCWLVSFVLWSLWNKKSQSN